MQTLKLTDVLRVTTYFIDSIDENIDIEVVVIGNWLAVKYGEHSKNDGVYILRQMLDEKDMLLHSSRIDVLIEKIVNSCKTIYSLLYPALSTSLVELLVNVCKVKYNNHIPYDVTGDLQRIATLIAGGYMMNDFLSGRMQICHNAISKDVYAVLEISSSATDEEVIKAFRRLTLKYHPDRLDNATAQEKEWASRKLQAVVEAKKLIMDHRGKTDV